MAGESEPVGCATKSITDIASVVGDPISKVLMLSCCWWQVVVGRSIVITSTQMPILDKAIVRLSTAGAAATGTTRGRAATTASIAARIITISFRLVSSKKVKILGR